MNTMATRIAPHPQVAASVHDDGLVLLHTGAGRLFAANRTGAHIWQALERGTSIAAIEASLTSHYGLAHERATREVAAFLAQLDRHGLLERRDRP
jgi:PqqD family protein of HPr-rel-A system